MTRRAVVSAAQTELDFSAPPPAPASGERVRPYRVRLGADLKAGVDAVDIAWWDLGWWPEGEPSRVTFDEDATARAMARYAARVASEKPRKPATEVAPTECAATRVRALLVSGQRTRDEVAVALGLTRAEAKCHLTHLRRSGHASRDRSTGVWALTPKGRQAAKREAVGKRVSTFVELPRRHSEEKTDEHA